MKPYRGKPDVRNFREGGWKRGPRRNCDPIHFSHDRSDPETNSRCSTLTNTPPLEGGRESLASAFSRAREMLREDDRQLAETLAGRREGEDTRAREARIARILDDPGKLRVLRRQT